MKIKLIEICDNNTGRKFINGDKTRTDSYDVKCAYNITQPCSPDCAACKINQSLDEAFCKRAGEGFNIGSIVDRNPDS